MPNPGTPSDISGLMSAPPPPGVILPASIPRGVRRSRRRAVQKRMHARLGTAHCAEFVMFRVEASVYVPVAVNCRDVPAAIEGLAGVIAIEVRIGGVMFTPTEEFTRPKEAVMAENPGLFPVTSPVALTLAADGRD